MPLNLASPGIVVREVDLTIGRVDPTSDRIGAIVGPFAQGPVELPTLCNNENDLFEVFGKPYNTDKQYETWLTASSFLSYGGPLRVVRSDDNGFANGFVGAATSVKIKSLDHYEELGYDESAITSVTYCARNPGSWSNGVKVAIIDGKADQILGLSTTGLTVGYGITQAVPEGTILPGAGTTSLLTGHFKGIITGIDTTSNTVDVKFLSHVSTAGTETAIDYQPGGIYQFANGTVAIHTSGQTSSYTDGTVGSAVDWFDQQSIVLSNSTIKWNNIADRPGTSEYAAARGARFDELHIAAFDDLGKVTGNVGTIIEKNLSLSKASDAEFSVGSPSYWRKFLQFNSNYLFGGSAPAGVTTTGYSSGFTLAGDTGWDQDAEGIIFDTIGTDTGTLSGGTNYNGIGTITSTNALSASVAKLSTGYKIFENDENYTVDFLLMGSANHTKDESRALAEQLISVAELRKDALAFISPYRGAALSDTDEQQSVTVRDDETITENVISYYSTISSSSYAIFDSGYKYMYDRFADTFRYIPLNGDIAGTCARNDINNFPWFSPAGTSRGTILNAVKLPYNPSKIQRDRLYSNRVNPVIFSPGSGIVLFGDKTGFAKASAFDRINVRRLFIFLEDAISAAAKDQLFEFNDEITRTNFVNIVEPFLRDVQSKRGIQDYVVICDETNNTAAIIDNNEFIADIYIKPARSINFIGLTFVATRTGVSFSEIIGNV